MADRKISELVALTTPAAGDYLSIIDISEAAAVSKNKRITIEELLRGAPDGTAAAPSIAFESDGGNGLYLAATDTIGISTNGVSRATISTTAITSALPIALSGSTSGSVTLTPVAVAGTTTITLPATTGTVITTGDSGTVTSTMIANGTIADADINASAAIAGTKISPNFGSQTVQTTGIFSHALGTAGAPTVTFTGDTNTGIYSPGADQVAISTGGSGRLFVDASGNVGINLSSSLGLTGYSGMLRIRPASSGAAGFFADNGAGDSWFGCYGGTGTADSAAIVYPSGGSLRIGTSTSVGVAGFSEKIRITSAGLVGIGTSAPGSLLDVGSGSGGSTAQFTLKGGTSAGDYGIFSIQNGSTVRGRLVADAGQDGLRIDMGGSAAGKLQIYTGASGTHAVTIDASQRVGIGTTSPARLLEVQNTNAATDGFARISSTNNGAFLEFAPAGSNTIRHYTVGSAVGGSLIFYDTTAGSQRAAIDSSGRLLVGTSSARSNFFNSSSFSPALQLEGTNDQGRLLSVIGSNTGGAGGVLVLASQKSGTVGGNTIVTDGGQLGLVSFQGSDGTEFVEAARIQVEVDGTPGANDMPGRLVFSTTADAASSPTEALRITNDRVICYNQPAPASFAAAATLTVADLKTGIIQYTGAAATLTLPTGTLTEGGFSGVYTNMTFEWSLINTGSGTATLGAGTNHTIVGRDTTLINTSSRFATRRTAANTFVSYRIA